MTQPTTHNPITDGRISRAILRLALPTWGAFFFHDLMGIADMFFVGKLGKDAVAAVGVGTFMIGIIITLVQSISVGTTALVSNAFGRRDPDRAADVAGQALVMALGLSVVLAACGIPLAPTIVHWMGAEGAVVEDGAAYIRILSGGGFAMLFAIALANALRGAGDARTPFVALMAANVINIVLDPLLIFGLGGFPELGVAGSAWATMAGRLVAALVMARSLLSGRGLIHLRWHNLRPRWPLIARIAKIGAYSSGRVMMRHLAMLLIMRLAASFGTAALAAFGLCFRLQMLIFGPTMGFSTAAATVVGQNLGAEQPERATRAGWTAAGLAICAAALLGAAYWLGAEHVIPVFNDDAEVVRLGSELLRWMSPSFLFMSLAMVLSFSMNGAGDTLRPMLITGTALLLFGVPLAHLLAGLWDDVSGVWVGLFASNVLAGLLAAWTFHLGAWREVGRRHAARERAENGR